jgi:hypothetical protein
VRHTFVSLLSDDGPMIETIADLVPDQLPATLPSGHDQGIQHLRDYPGHKQSLVADRNGVTCEKSLPGNEVSF